MEEKILSISTRQSTFLENTPSNYNLTVYKPITTAQHSGIIDLSEDTNLLLSQNKTSLLGQHQTVVIDIINTPMLKQHHKM